MGHLRAFLGSQMGISGLLNGPLGLSVAVGPMLCSRKLRQLLLPIILATLCNVVGLMSPALDKRGSANETYPGVVDGGGLDDGGQSYLLAQIGCGRGNL
jgi:hypothetical protein